MILLLQVDPVDAGLVHDLARCCRGCFAPLCAALGGIVAQEALKALTGKFTPLNQWVIKSIPCLFLFPLISVNFNFQYQDNIAWIKFLSLICHYLKKRP